MSNNIFGSLSSISPKNKDRGSKQSTRRSQDKRDSQHDTHNPRNSTKLDCAVDLKPIVPVVINENHEVGRETKKIMKLTKGTSNPHMQPLSMEKSSLAVELEDPSNEYLRLDIQRIMQMSSEVSSLENDYKNLEEIKNEVKNELNELMKKDFNKSNCVVQNSQYSSYLKGLSKLIENFEKDGNKEVIRSREASRSPEPRQVGFGKEKSFNNSFEMDKGEVLNSSSTKTNTANIMVNKKQIPKHAASFNEKSNKKPINSPKNNDNLKKSEEMLEAFYANVGHDYYTKILKMFEKYSQYGKVNSSFNMDYTQFSTFMTQNQMYDKNIEKTYSELIFNKIKGLNKLIEFEDFLKIIIEFSKKEFPWEKDQLRTFKYFINRRINHFPCLEKSYQEKNLERFYFFLEYDDYQQEVKKFLPALKRNFIRYKHSDLRINECISSDGFIKMSKDLTIIPVFMSGKEIVEVVNYVKYHKKSLFPTGNISFCSYVEVLCLIAFQSFDKYSQEDNIKKYVDHIEKLKIFLKFIVEKAQCS